MLNNNDDDKIFMQDDCFCYKDGYQRGPCDSTIELVKFYCGAAVN